MPQMTEVIVSFLNGCRWTRPLRCSPRGWRCHSCAFDPGGWGGRREDVTHIFGRSVLGCIEADFCNWTYWSVILQHFSRPTFFALFCVAANSNWIAYRISSRIVGDFSGLCKKREHSLQPFHISSRCSRHFCPDCGGIPDKLDCRRTMCFTESFR